MPEYDYLHPGMISTREAEARIREKVAMVVADERNFGALSLLEPS